MATLFPGGVDTFPAASTLATHQLSSDPHSTLHGNLGDALNAVETYTLNLPTLTANNVWTGANSFHGTLTAYELDALAANPATTPGVLKLWTQSSSSMSNIAYGFAAPMTGALAGVIWNLPGFDGSASQPLITDGAGNLSFSPVDMTTVALTNSGNQFAADQVIEVDNGLTNAPNCNLVIQADSAGTPTVGFGEAIKFLGKSSTATSRDMGRWNVTWATATDASRKARFVGTVYDTAVREWIRGEASGSAPMIGFLGNAAVVQQANASQAAITAVTDANAKSALQAIYNLLKNYGLAPATA